MKFSVSKRENRYLYFFLSAEISEGNAKLELDSNLVNWLLDVYLWSVFKYLKAQFTHSEYYLLLIVVKIKWLRQGNI